MPAQTKGKASSPKKKKVGEVRAAYQIRGARVRPPSANSILKKCKAVLVESYGARFKGLVLYGSLARKQAAPNSDIDLLVLLSPPVDYFVELRRVVDVLYPIQLESDQLISAKPVAVDDFEQGRISLYRNAKREGMTVK